MLHAAQWQRVLAHKVVFGCLVVVLHDKAHQGELWRVHGEAQCVVPHRVEPCRGRICRGVSVCVCMLLVGLARVRSRTVVVDVSGLLSGLVCRDAVDLHPHQRVHDGPLFDVDFGQLLAADHLEAAHCE